ncbi:MAG: tetratricopeptide repeat protein [Candidatus Magasanikbacteria bacterium]|nr:tetratricopeptide repeat protein [Candidatus Magasanikbacteria bacterium]
MLLNILLIIVAVGVAVILAVLGRHLREAAQLDVDNLPLEQEYRKKQAILGKRLEAEGKILRERSEKLLRPLKKFWDIIQTKFRVYVYKIEKLWRYEKVLRKTKAAPRVPEERQNKIDSHLKQGEESLARATYDTAESAFIAAIKLDPKCAAAYHGLAKTYMGRESWEEARQTLLFLAKLDPSNDNVFAALGEVAEKLGDVGKAIEYYQEAVILNDALSPRFYHLAELLLKENQPAVAREAVVSALALEPKNPKYLDLLVETAILMGDQDEAERGFQEMRLVNPENQKLAEWKERIAKIER